MELMEVKGKRIAFYSIGEFASMIDRDSQTIRKWEYGGVLPPTVFKRRTGVRIYPEPVVMEVKKLCKKYKLRQGKPMAKEFSVEATEKIKEITAEILKGGDSNVE